MSGRMGSAIEQTVRWYPGLLESNQNLMFMLKCRQFIEMVNGCDFDVSFYSIQFVCPRGSCALWPIHFQSPISRGTVAGGQQTSVIQSTKTYQNGSSGSGSGSGLNGSGLISDILAVHQMDAEVDEEGVTTGAVKSNSSNNNNYAPMGVAVDSDCLMQHVNHVNNLLNVYDNNGAGGGGNDFMNDVEMENGHAVVGHVVSNSSNGKWGRDK